LGLLLSNHEDKDASFFVNASPAEFAHAASATETTYMGIVSVAEGLFFCFARFGWGAIYGQGKFITVIWARYVA
jgi:hypothetical protein